MASPYDTLISEIYLGGAGMRSWSAPLRSLAALANCRNALLNCSSFQTTPASLVYVYDDGDLDHDAMAGYGDFMQEVGDPRVEYAGNLFRSGQRGIYSDHDFTEEQNMRRDPYYAEVLPAVGLRYALVGLLQLRGEVGFGLALQRSPEQGPPDDHMKRVLSAVRYHFVQALEMQEILQQQAPASTDQFRPFQMPRNASMLDSTGSLLAGSADLEAQLLDAGILRLRGNHLEATTAQSDAQMRRALRSAAGGAPSQIDLASRQLRLRFVPIVGEGGLFLPAELIALMIEPMAAPACDPVIVARDRYGLTPSEAQVVQLLSTGASLKAIAEQRSVSVWTVRTHVKSIFRKMGLRSQREILAWCTQINGRQETPDRP